MSFSAARPIVIAPAVPAAADERGESNFTKRVARFDTSAVLTSITVNSAGGVDSSWAGASVLTTVSWCGVPRGGRAGAWRGRETGCLGGGGLGGLGGCLGGTGRGCAPLARPRAGCLGWLPVWPRCCDGGTVGFVSSGIADQARVGGPESRAGLDWGGWAAWPCCGPIAKVSRGPRGFPTLMLWPS